VFERAGGGRAGGTQGCENRDEEKVRWGKLWGRKGERTSGKKDREVRKGIVYGRKRIRPVNRYEDLERIRPVNRYEDMWNKLAGWVVRDLMRQYVRHRAAAGGGLAAQVNFFPLFLNFLLDFCLAYNRTYETSSVTCSKSSDILTYLLFIKNLVVSHTGTITVIFFGS
jgi:hypothetical protein